MGKRLAVYGAGAIGGQVGARMFTAGHDVTLIEPWNAQFRAIRESGLRIEDETGSVLHRPRILQPHQLDRLEPVDILFLAVKSYDSSAAMETILPHLSPRAWVVSTQNGINEEIIARRVESGRILGIVILINAVLEAPGRIRVSTQSVSRSSNLGAPGAYVGEYAGSSGNKAREVARYLNAVWPAKTTEDLVAMRWTKLATSAMVNALSGITGLRSAPLLAEPRVRRIMVRLAAEVVLAARAHGHGIHRVLGNCTPDQVLDAARGLDGAMEQGLSRMSELISPAAATSLLQDHWKGRITEVDHFNGFVVRKGREKNVPTPVNEEIRQLMKKIERNEVSSGLDLLDPLVERLPPFDG
jgi:2-dehydropantoate 2-reductase